MLWGRGGGKGEGRGEPEVHGYAATASYLEPTLSTAYTMSAGTYLHCTETKPITGYFHQLASSSNHGGKPLRSIQNTCQPHVSICCPLRCQVTWTHSWHSFHTHDAATALKAIVAWESSKLSSKQRRSL